MKNLLIALCIGLASHIVHAQVPNLDVFYLNGIANSQEDVSKSIAALRQALAPLTGNLPVKRLYNPTGSWAGSSATRGCLASNFSGTLIIPFADITQTAAINSGSTPSSVPGSVSIKEKLEPGKCALSDLGELSASKINEERYGNVFSRQLVVGNSPQTYFSGMQTEAQNLITDYFTYEKTIIDVMSKQVAAALKASATANRKVLLIAHSQGNLIANLAWIRLVATLPVADLRNIRILNVANTSQYSVHGEDVTHNLDIEIGNLLPALGLKNFRNTSVCPGIAEFGGNNICAFRVVLPTYVAIPNSLSSWDNHNFIAAYLSDMPVTRVSDNQATSFKQAVVASAERLLRGMGAIPNAMPVARFTTSATSAAVGSAISFNASTSTDSDGSIASYAWSFGDGATATGVSASRAYAGVGSYTVTLTVTDNAGASASTTRNVTITPAPQPDLVPSALSVSPSSVQPGAVVNVSWTMTNSGNGNALASQTGIRLLPASTSGFGSSANNLVNVPIGALAAGGSTNQNQAITIPAATAPGSYVIVVVADNTNPSVLGQSNTGNDFARSDPFTVASPPATGGTQFQDDFSGAALDSSKWIVEAFNGNLATYTQSNGYLNITVPGGSSGASGITDGAKFKPRVAPITGDFELILSAEEINRTSRSGYNVLSNIQLLMTGTSAELGIYIIGDNINNQGIRGHQIYAYYRNGNSVVSTMTRNLTVGQYYAFQFRIRRSAGLSYLAYKLSGDATWTETAVPASFLANAVSVPSIVIASGDGGNTRVNSSFQARFDSVTIGQ